MRSRGRKREPGEENRAEGRKGRSRRTISEEPGELEREAGGEVGGAEVRERDFRRRKREELGKKRNEQDKNVQKRTV